MSEMTCREFDEVIHGFVRMDLLDVNEREAVMEHAAHCQACAQHMADAAALAEVSEAIGKSVQAEHAPAHVEASLLAAFRHHHRGRSWRRSWEWAGVGAAAAVALMILWIASGRTKGPAVSPAPRKDVASETNLPQEAKAAVASQSSAVSAPVDTPSGEAAASETYAASDFVPVPFTGGISADDPGMIVRVQLTRSSLAQLGYPVAETPDEDLILADVLVGEDGWPRGVKVVQ
jgi:anti-sigma factor RsiW